MFASVVDRAKRKAARRQTHGVHAAARALVINLAQTKIAEDLTHDVHMAGAREALEDVEPLDYGLDALAFVVRVLPQGLAAMLYVIDDSGALSLDQAEALFAEWP